MTVATGSLTIIHELSEETLYATRDFLSRHLGFTEFKFLHSSKLANQLNNIDQAVVLHLGLDTEIEMHKSISKLIADRLLNPYDIIAELADNKFKFYQYMLAAEITQPMTALWTAENCVIDLSRNPQVHNADMDDLITSLRASLDQGSSLVLKPCHGTEKIDFMILDSKTQLARALEHAAKIFTYDDLLVQEYVSHVAEYRVLYLFGEFYSRTPFPSKYKTFLFDSIGSLALEPKILAFDLLDTGERLIPLEMNIRPAAIYSCNHKC